MLPLAAVDDSSSHVSKQAALAIVFAVLAQYESSTQTELCSELLCWVVLPVLVRKDKARKAHTDIDDTSKPALPSHLVVHKNDTSSTSLWLVALCLMLASVYRAESKTTIAFVVSRFPVVDCRDLETPH